MKRRPPKSVKNRAASTPEASTPEALPAEASICHAHPRVTFSFMSPKIKINIITGALGAGKTSLISCLIKAKAGSSLWRDERWSVLVNEFGSLGIDGALLESASSSSSSPSPISVREMAGGCLCCTLSGPLAMAVPQLIRQTKPTRLLIEPSGLGHPSKLLELLQGENLRNSLEIMAVISLADIRVVNERAYLSNSTYQSQIDVADALIGTFEDVSTPEEVTAFHTMASELFPPKTVVTASLSGSLVNVLVLLGSILDLPRDSHFATLLAPSTSTQTSLSTQADPRTSGSILLRYISSSGSGSGKKVEAVGWSFPPSVEFNRTELVALCQSLSPSAGSTLRLKGIVRIKGEGFKSIKYQASGEVDFEDLNLPKTDPSRIEIILSPNPKRYFQPQKDIPLGIQAVVDAILSLDFDSAEQGLMEGLIMRS